MPPDATTITRDGADASSRGRSARVSRNGDKTCVANVSSLPSPVTVYSWVSAPAFRTSTSRRSCRSAKRAAKAAVSARDERSARSASTAEPAAAEISLRARSVRSGSRPTMQTCPPSAAIDSAAACERQRPLPAVPRRVDDLLLRAVGRGRHARAGPGAEAAGDLREAAPAPRRPRARDRLRLGSFALLAAGEYGARVTGVTSSPASASRRPASPTASRSASARDRALRQSVRLRARRCRVPRTPRQRVPLSS